MPSPGDARDTRAHPRDPTIRLMRIAPMFVRRSLIALAVACTFVACEDTTGPVNDHGAMPGPQLSRMPSPAMHIVRQSPSAPPLEAYRESFWASVGQAATVRVGCLSEAVEALGH